MLASWRDGVSALLIAGGACVLGYSALKPPVAYHPVTAAMSDAAGMLAGRPATAIEAVGTDGLPHSPASESRDRPAVVVFIRDGCPCSEAAEPYFRMLHEAYGADVRFLGVMDEDLATARAWAGRFGTRYPILADPDRRIIRACEAERSVYVMLLAPGGTVEAFWPGYSSTMLLDLGSRLARLARRPESRLDVDGAPEKLVSGCRF